ncbi:hypothetical protein C8D88_111121 [Lentzea atacamensis]|uniref:Uncharacterized protein n=1 Tax=Lentzea atacamensis TaxID=531938 RepID=A0A316HRZ9_9PSEU|nr:hypothetical protein [Lentzea atacamensis]PWK83236.1 hypothetical protein C8D88_111121 [Lentzea atacamensis]
MAQERVDLDSSVGYALKQAAALSASSAERLRQDLTACAAALKP